MLVALGHKTLGAKWLFELCVSHQSSLYLDRKVAPKSPAFHTAIVVCKGKKRKFIEETSVQT